MDLIFCLSKPLSGGQLVATGQCFLPASLPPMHFQPESPFVRPPPALRAPPNPSVFSFFLSPFPFWDSFFFPCWQIAPPIRHFETLSLCQNEPTQRTLFFPCWFFPLFQRGPLFPKSDTVSRPGPLLTGNWVGLAGGCVVPRSYFLRLFLDVAHPATIEV